MKSMFGLKKRKGEGRFSHSVTGVVTAEPHANASTKKEQIGTANSTDVQQHTKPAFPSSSPAARRTEKYGLFLISSPPSPFADAEVGKTYYVDIVAVHGIIGDAYDTWTHENGKSWLRDFLPEDLPGVRVFSFGYPAEVFLSLSTGDLDAFGRSLLEGLKRERRQKEVGFVL